VLVLSSQWGIERNFAVIIELVQFVVIIVV